MPGGGPPVPPVEKPGDVVVQRFSRITNTVTPITGGRHMCEDSTGMIWRVWAEESDGGTYRVRASYTLPSPPTESSQWFYAFPETVASGAFEPQALCVCVDENDEPMVLAVVIFLGVYYAYPYHRSSGTWSVKTPQSIGYMAEWISMECDQAGTYHVLYPSVSAANVHNVTYRSSSDSFGTWSVAFNLFNNSSQHNGTAGYVGTEARGAIAVDRDGDLHTVSCFVGTNAKWRLAYRKYSSGWATAENIELVELADQYSVSRSQRMVSLAVDKDGVPHVVFVRGNASSYPEKSSVWYSNRIGGSWSTIEQITDSYPYDWEYPSIALEMEPDVDQVIHVVACGIASTDSGLTDKSAYRIEHDGTDWQGPETIYTPPSGDSATNGQALHMVCPSGLGTMNTGYLLGFTASAIGGLTWPIDADRKNQGRPDDDLTLAEIVTGRKDAIRVSVEEILDVQYSVRPSATYDKSKIEYLTLAETVATNMLPRETVTVGETALGNGEWNRSASETVEIDEAVSVTIPGRCETAFTPTPDVLASYDSRLYTVLSGPYGAPTTTVYLPRPNFSDIRVLDVRVVTQRNMAQQPLQFAKDNPIHTLRLSWRGLSRRRILEVDNFFAVVRGRSLTYRDHEANDWQVVVASSPVRLQYGDAKDFDNSLELEFEGVEISS